MKDCDNIMSFLSQEIKGEETERIDSVATEEEEEEDKMEKQKQSDIYE